MHQQTLRNYERWNLVIPYRSPGGTRYYSIIDIEKIEKVKDWIEKFGINRAGIEIITDLMKEIKPALDEAGIEIPFPQRVIHKKNSKN